MPELSTETKGLISKYALWKASLKPSNASAIHVDEVALKVAAFYEQIRTIIDWKEEHLMRRAAIIRKLKRRFLDLELNNSLPESMAELLVLELIRGGYFPNDKIEESKIVDVQKIIDKHVFILKNNPENKQGKAGLKAYNQLLEIAACEIEETLAPSIKEMALIDYMFLQMKKRIKINEGAYQKNLLKKEDVDIQIYVAVQQSLFKLDTPIISYNLIKYKYPQWVHATQEDLLRFSQNIDKILYAIEKDLSHPLAKKFYTICEKYDTPYLLLGDILTNENVDSIGLEIIDPPKLEAHIRKAYLKRLKELKIKIQRAAIYSTLSIFITKILSLLVLEVILARIFSGHLNVLYLFIDIAIPTTLMCLLIISIKPPSMRNLNLAVKETIKIIYDKEVADAYEIKIAPKRSAMTRSILSLSYVLGAFVSFGLIYWVFSFFRFPVSSIIINIVFIALILFAATAIQTRGKELTIEEESEGFLGFLYDILFLPMLGVGRWLSQTWKQYNAIVVFFNFLIDMPFSAFIEFLERWRYFIKEKKEDLR
ncbi:MAG: hypothetical protein Q7S10_03880 [bacterium]|nr:hypothetical protein [bacterium]